MVSGGDQPDLRPAFARRHAGSADRRRVLPRVHGRVRHGRRAPPHHRDREAEQAVRARRVQLPRLLQAPAGAAAEAAAAARRGDHVPGRALHPPRRGGPDSDLQQEGDSVLHGPRDRHPQAALHCHLRHRVRGVRGVFEQGRTPRHPQAPAGSVVVVQNQVPLRPHEHPHAVAVRPGRSRRPPDCRRGAGSGGDGAAADAGHGGQLGGGPRACRT
mmetsp:Transcript_61813/g.145747  ORF Transcript_61813/g.145747 Transcript_61813/m.145747 type:complete len:215 (-) Transcript_61813:249-893(-)